MPTEPNTGIELPYKGQPGYDEAKAAFPEVYAAEEGGTAGDEGPRDAAMEGQDMDMDMQQMAAPSGPMPTKPFSKNAVKTLLKELNKALDKFAGQNLPDIEIEMEGKGAKLEGALPPQLFLTLSAIADTLRMLGEDFNKKYGFDPMSLVTDADLRKATANIKKMAKDKKLIEAMNQPVPGVEAGPPPMNQTMEPSMTRENDQALAAAMA